MSEANLPRPIIQPDLTRRNPAPPPAPASIEACPDCRIAGDESLARAAKRGTGSSDESAAKRGAGSSDESASGASSVEPAKEDRRKSKP